MKLIEPSMQVPFRFYHDLSTMLFPILVIQRVNLKNIVKLDESYCLYDVCNTSWSISEMQFQIQFLINVLVEYRTGLQFESIRVQSVK